MLFWLSQTKTDARAVADHDLMGVVSQVAGMRTILQHPLLPGQTVYKSCVLNNDAFAVLAKSNGGKETANTRALPGEWRFVREDDPEFVAAKLKATESDKGKVDDFSIKSYVNQTVDAQVFTAVPVRTYSIVVHVLCVCFRS
jgi:hypothetical protein